MKKYKDLKETLQLYTVENASEKSVLSTKRKVLEAKSLVFPQPLRIKPLIKSQIRTIRFSLWLFCFAYMIIISLVAFFREASDVLMAIATVTPFLSVVAIPSLFYYSNPECMELEQACLYEPKTALSAKLLICSAADLITVFIASLISSSLGTAGLFRCLLFAFGGFFVSSFLTLGICIFFKAQTSILLSFALFFSFVVLVFGNSTVKNTCILCSNTVLFLGMIVFASLFAAVLIITLKRYDFERSVIKIGNSI